MRDTRFNLTCEEFTGEYFLNDNLTGKCYSTGTDSYATAREAMAQHIICSFDYNDATALLVEHDLLRAI